MKSRITLAEFIISIVLAGCIFLLLRHGYEKDIFGYRALETIHDNAMDVMYGRGNFKPMMPANERQRLINEQAAKRITEPSATIGVDGH